MLISVFTSERPVCCMWLIALSIVAGCASVGKDSGWTSPYGSADGGFAGVSAAGAGGGIAGTGGIGGEGGGPTAGAGGQSGMAAAGVGGEGGVAAGTDGAGVGGEGGVAAGTDGAGVGGEGGVAAGTGEAGVGGEGGTAGTSGTGGAAGGGEPDSSCDSEQYDGRTYWFCTDNFDWDAAHEACQAVGGDLASINSEEEQNFIIGTAGSGEWLVGLNKKNASGTTAADTWEWVDGSEVSGGYENWDSGEPDSLDCGAMNDGAWRDISCTNGENWICEIP